MQFPTELQNPSTPRQECKQSDYVARRKAIGIEFGTLEISRLLPSRLSLRAQVSVWMQSNTRLAPELIKLTACRSRQNSEGFRSIHHHGCLAISAAAAAFTYRQGERENTEAGRERDRERASCAFTQNVCTIRFIHDVERMIFNFAPTNYED